MIRAAGPGDIPAIMSIWNPVIRDTLITFNPQEKTAADLAHLLAAKADAGHPFLVAEAAGLVLGFATYGAFRSGAGYAHTMEHTVILAPAARGQGTGRALIAGLVAQARAAGAHSLIAGVSAANPGGVAFHAAVGFAEVARLPQVGRKFDQWLDLVLMQKFLDFPA
ncbi:GNAT family N-acetyltransferase [Actibacterium sp. D379-3]